MDEEKLELNDQITKLKEKVELLVKEKEKLESELKTKSLSNEDVHLVRYYKFHETSGFCTEYQGDPGQKSLNLKTRPCYESRMYRL